MSLQRIRTSRVRSYLITRLRTALQKNGVAGYPDEWFPSVSATIGDWYPERNIFQIFIAFKHLVSPRFTLVSLQYFLRRSPNTNLPGFLFAVGIVRTLMCGGWVYITSNDDHDVHDVLMVTYILCNVPWMWGGVLCTPIGHVEARRRRLQPICKLGLTIVINLAYTRSSFFEWSLILLDVLFDSITELDFKASNLQIVLGVSLDASIGCDDMYSQLHHLKTQAALTLSRDARAVIGFISDVYLSYLFWSIFTSLITTLFYFSVWQLALSGSELSLLVLLSPALLGIRPLRTCALMRSGQVTLRAVAILIGLGSYALKSPMQRLIVVDFANVVLLVGQTADWSARKGGYQGLLLGLGLVSRKHANHFFVPSSSTSRVL
ncbi:Frag1/DRAM/Sfk1 family-domain-containing protein [Suillus tomentosus]|nr:Frag1/DRAM/Sfk1 family-domain-containing protein [Suillus tomentosus]